MKRYWIDLSRKIPVINLSEGDELKLDMEYFGVSTPEEITKKDPLMRVFKTIGSAEKFLEKFLVTHLDLASKVKTIDKKVPSILMKKTFITLAVMNEKMLTVRNGERLKGAKEGDLIILHDQKIKHAVKLKKKVKREDGKFEYHFSNIK